MENMRLNNFLKSFFRVISKEEARVRFVAQMLGADHDLVVHEIVFDVGSNSWVVSLKEKSP